MSKRDGSNGNGNGRKIAQEKPLSPSERIFVQLLADVYDGRSIGDKAVQAGLDYWTGYKIHRTERIEAAVDAITAEDEKAMRRERLRVRRTLVRRSERDHEGAIANEAAKLFLQSFGDIGTGGSTTHVNVQQTNQIPGTLEERLADTDRVLASRLVSRDS